MLLSAAVLSICDLFVTTRGGGGGGGVKLNAPGEKLSRFLKMAGVGLGFSLFSYNN